MKKIESFKSFLQSEILGKRLTTNADVLNFTYREGHIPRHAADALKHMKSERLIDYEGSSPMVTYDNVYKLKRIIHYKIN